MHMHAKPPHRVLIAAIILTFGFALVELAGGLWSNSLALLSDAGHMGSDALALGIAAFAAWIALKPPSDKHTFGLGRAEVIAAWLSSLLMFVISIVVIVEAVKRFHNPHPIDGPVVMVIAFIGMLVNIYIAWLLSKSEQTLNIRAAMLHVLSDLLGSLAALVSGAVVTFTHWIEIDPILSILIAVLIMFSSVQLLKESLAVLMEGTPRNISISKVKQSMLSIPAIESLHDLHIWTLSSGRIVLSAHVVIETMECWEHVLQELHQILRNDYHIEHVTLQPELHIHVIDKACASSKGQNHDH
ncbi:MAG: cation diffusion facilitator family transporter [Coxiellaceae bacterium]|nr:cation diffusion facilitator family transporter [Coxiellaceae bacterium]